jgi:hypothetical protein
LKAGAELLLGALLCSGCLRGKPEGAGPRFKTGLALVEGSDGVGLDLCCDDEGEDASWERSCVSALYSRDCSEAESGEPFAFVLLPADAALMAPSSNMVNARDAEAEVADLVEAEPPAALATEVVAALFEFLGPSAGGLNSPGE